MEMEFSGEGRPERPLGSKVVLWVEGDWRGQSSGFIG